MREIRGNAKNIRSLLGGAKFAIDYYQREYRWETKQVAELVEDLAEKFLDSSSGEQIGPFRGNLRDVDVQATLQHSACPAGDRPGRASGDGAPWRSSRAVGGGERPYGR